MKDNVTVDEAIEKGRLQLKFLPFVVTFGCIGAGIYLAVQGIYPIWIALVGFLVGFLSGWLVWSYFVMKWKIWAYENVRNINELQRKAVEEKLIWETGSWFEKTEFKDYQQKQKLKQLEKKFLEKDVYNDDSTVIEETVIVFCTTTVVILLLMYLMIGLAGAWILFTKEYIGLAPLALGIYLSYNQIKKLIDTKPQIIISERGIKLKQEDFISWDKIHNDRIYNESNGKSTTTYLIFNEEKIVIGEMNIKQNELENLLHVYRVRYEKNNSK